MSGLLLLLYKFENFQIFKSHISNPKSQFTYLQNQVEVGDRIRVTKCPASLLYYEVVFEWAKSNF